MLHCSDGPGLDMPMLADKSGIFIRREGIGGHYICGAVPPLASISRDLLMAGGTVRPLISIIRDLLMVDSI